MTTTRNEKSARNIYYGILKQVILLVLNFLAKTIFIKAMGKEFLGLNGIFNNIFLMFSFAELGVGTVMLYSFYEPLAKGNHTKCATLYAYFRKIYGLIGLGIIGLGILIVPFLHIIVDVHMPMRNVILYYVLYMMSCFFNNLFLCQSNVLIADQNQYIVTRIQIGLETICLILQSIVIFFFQNFTMYILLMVIKFLAMGILYMRKIYQKYPYMNFQNEELSPEDKRPILENIKTLMIYKFARTLINASDNVIISIMVGTIWVGMYSNYEFVVMGVWGLITAFFSAISASVGNLIVEKDAKEQYKIYRIIEMLNVWIGGFTSTCLVVLFQDFIQLWVGKTYQLHFSIMLVIVLNYYLRCMREGISMFRETAGMFKEFKNITIITAILNIVLSFALGYFMGMAGIFIATAISVLVTYFWYEPYLVYKKLFKKPIRPYFKRQCVNIVFTLVVMFVTYGICETFVENFIFKCVVCFVVSNAIYALYFWSTPQFKYVWNIGKVLLKKRGMKNEG